MLSHSQTMKLLELHRKDTASFFHQLPIDVVNLIAGVGYDPDPNSEIGIALRHAHLGTKNDIDIVIAMVKKIPSILLQAGDVVSECKIYKRIKLYEFFLAENYTACAKKIEFGFAAIPNGESERARQYERYEMRLAARKMTPTCNPI